MNYKKSTFAPSFSIIHHYNSPNSAVTVDGKEVHREEKIWYAEYDDNGQPFSGEFITCAPDDEHFVYSDPMWKNIIGRWNLMCTCGSIAVIVGSNVYAPFGSPTTDEGSAKGKMIVCKHFLDYGKHQWVKK